MSLRDSAVLVTANFSRWRPKIADKKISREVTESHGTSSSAGDFLKYLFPTFRVGSENKPTYPELQIVLNTLDTLYVWHMAHTLTWNGKGVRLLPVAMAEEHRAKFDEVAGKLPSLLDDMTAGFYEALSRARQELNGMFREADYPSKYDLRDKFQVSVAYDAIPEIITSNLPASVRDLINSQIETRVSSALESSKKDAWQRLYKCVENLQVKLASPGAIFRDSLVGNVRECCDLMATWNVSGDVHMEEVRQAVLADVLRYDTDDIRNDSGVRSITADAASSVLRTIRKITHVQEEGASA